MNDQKVQNEKVVNEVVNAIPVDLSKSAYIDKVNQFVKANKQTVLDLHKTISTNWLMWKSREVATVESAIRGIANDMQRLAEALPKAKLDGKDDTKVSPGAVSKPK